MFMGYPTITMSLIPTYLSLGRIRRDFFNTGRYKGGEEEEDEGTEEGMKARTIMDEQ